MADANLTAERLRELLHYDPETGVFTRKIRTSNRINVGDVAGTIRNDGYISIRVDGVRLKAHRAAWLFVYGLWPDFNIDHINGDKSDNRITNLQDVSQGENNQNIKRCRSDNTHGFLGVSRNGIKWKARIQIGNKSLTIGNFKTPELAHAAYLEAKRRLHKNCTI